MSVLFVGVMWHPVFVGFDLAVSTKATTKKKICRKRFKKTPSQKNKGNTSSLLSLYFWGGYCYVCMSVFVIQH